MKKEIKTAFKDLLDSLKKELNNEDNLYIAKLMPGVGRFWTEEKDCDENGNWGFTNSCVTISKDDAIYEAQTKLLKEKDYLDEFFFEEELREKMFIFMRALSKEIVK